jgi:hypothetical protein
MSLDIYLCKKNKVQESSNTEDKSTFNYDEILYEANITHNLGKMAKEAGFYQALWRPEEIGITKAKELEPYIRKGVQEMVEKPDYYEQFNSPNGWGTYDNFLPWLVKLNRALKKYPEAFIEASR